MSYFNVRVYGLLINDEEQLLLSDECEYGQQFTKFPGGGLELGEGLLEGIKREFKEECDLSIEVIRHFYTTDFYERSAFNESQVISIYYLVKALEPLQVPISSLPFDFAPQCTQAFRWVALSELRPEHVTFRTDQTVVKLLTQEQSI